MPRPSSSSAPVSARARTTHSAGRNGVGQRRRDHWLTVPFLGLIWLYQRTLSPVLPAVFGSSCGCRFYPTCSHYTAEALRSRGLLIGGWLAFLRLLKCTPLHPGGFDPVPAATERRRAKPGSAGPRRSPAPRCTRASA